jgi:hypothetical protein
MSNLFISVFSKFIFSRRIQIYYTSSQEVQSTPNIIKIATRFFNHQTINIVARMSRRRAAVVALLWPDVVDNSGLCVYAYKKRRSRA